MTNPKISIVTPSFNQGQYIEQTILSIIEQDYDNVELIIIDGGSTDNTVEIIKKYENQIAYWVSEKDNGQAHAINKGLKIATGDIFNWINSDDFLEQGALRSIADSFIKNPEQNVVCGFTRCFWDEDNSTWLEYRMGLKSTVADTIVNVEMNQPGTFYKTHIVREFGGVNESLRYVFDDELWFRYLCKYGLQQVSLIRNRLAQFRLHGNSKSIGEGFDGFNAEVQSLYLDMAKNINAPEWLLECMDQVENSNKYISVGKWNCDNLEQQKFTAYFATKYIHQFYQSGQKKLAKEALRMAIKNDYFKWNRMMTSLRIKLLFQ